MCQILYFFIFQCSMSHAQGILMYITIINMEEDDVETTNFTCTASHETLQYKLHTLITNHHNSINLFHKYLVFQKHVLFEKKLSEIFKLQSKKKPHKQVFIHFRSFHLNTFF